VAVTAATPAYADPSVDAGQNATGPALELPEEQRPFPWLAAHRGQWRSAPENSIPAVEDAMRDGSEIIEIDIRMTKDGHLVLMHDETVDRTTNGSGKVSDLTLDQIKDLRLRKGLGSGPAPLTDQRVPTFDQVLDAVEGKNVLLNLDKGWPIREALYAALERRGMAEYGLFKGAPNAEEATQFMSAHPDALYMHIVNDSNHADAGAFTDRVPVAFEVVFDRMDDVQAQPEYWAKLDAISEIWINTMWSSLDAGYTDEASLRDPKLGWQEMVDRGATMIQTDNVTMFDAWREGVDVTRVGMSSSSIRVQAEDYINDPAHYGDDTSNSCGSSAIRDASSPVDACNLDGAHVVQDARNGEWFTLPVEVPKSGHYRVRIRHSSDTAPGGTVRLDLGDGYRDANELPNTTHERAFEITRLGKYEFEAGRQQVRLRFTHPDSLSVDWIQLDPA
jgi:glycerophosphoryl diester phosphodiesterase